MNYTIFAKWEFIIFKVTHLLAFELVMICASPVFLPTVFCLVNMDSSRLPANSECNAQQSSSKSLDSQPWAKDSVSLTNSTWPAECPTLPAHSTAYGGKVLPTVQMVVSIHVTQLSQGGTWGTSESFQTKLLLACIEEKLSQYCRLSPPSSQLGSVFIFCNLPNHLHRRKK